MTRRPAAQPPTRRRRLRPRPQRLASHTASLASFSVMNIFGTTPRAPRRSSAFHVEAGHALHPHRVRRGRDAPPPDDRCLALEVQRGLQPGSSRSVRFVLIVALTSSSGLQRLGAEALSNSVHYTPEGPESSQPQRPAVPIRPVAIARSRPTSGPPAIPAPLRPVGITHWPSSSTPTRASPMRSRTATSRSTTPTRSAASTPTRGSTRSSMPSLTRS